MSDQELLMDEQPQDAVAGSAAESIRPDDSPVLETAPFAEAGQNGLQDEADGGSPAQGPSQDELIARYEAMLSQERAEKARLEQERQAVQIERQQIQAQQAQAQWDQLEAQALAHARTLDYDQALQYMADFSRQRTQAVMGAAQQMTQQVNIAQFRQHVIQKYGLSSEDAARLGSDPYQFDPIGASIKAEREHTNSKIGALEKQIEQLKRQSQAQARIASGVDRSGGPGGQPLPNDLSKLTHKEELRALMQQGGMI